MTKNEIIKAALKVWGREFYLNTSLTQVARELGVSKPALYRHFKNKQALLDAMYEYFMNDYAAFIRPGYEQAAALAGKAEKMTLLLKIVVEYYARNADAFLFSLFNVYGSRDQVSMEQDLDSLGIDMRAIYAVEEEYENPLLLRISFTTIIFAVANFYKLGHSFDKTPSEDNIQKLIGAVGVIISRGLSFKRERVDALDYEELEKRIFGVIGTVEDNSLLKAVAQAVAEAGPWNASMDMVAKRSGLSKSSLYAHFKSKKDMLRQLFMGEFKRLFAFARDCLRRSSRPEEQFYLGIFSIVAYLCSHSEILLAMDWIRTRRLDLGKPMKPGILGVFDEIDFAEAGNIEQNEITSALGGDKRQMSQWVIFLIISILMRRSEGMSFTEVPNDNIRTLYRFITLGLEGFNS
ncbi:MAG: TetR/AcrR family transcriptional regulator [Treponema sp.]|nr:TetR/AcrR family transcriptional regulator [Treponema sp.]